MVSEAGESRRTRPLVAGADGDERGPARRYEYLELFLTARLPLEEQTTPWHVVTSQEVPLEPAYRNEAAALNALGALGWRVVDVARDVDRAHHTTARHYLLERELP